MNERYELAIERIRSIGDENTVAPIYRDYFQKVAGFIIAIDRIKNRLEEKPNTECALEELRQEIDEVICVDIKASGIQTVFSVSPYSQHVLNRYQ